MTALDTLVHDAGWSAELFCGLVLYSLACLGCGLAAVSIGSKRDALHERPAYFVLSVSFLFGLGALGQLWTLSALAGVMRPTYVASIVLALAMVAIIWSVRHSALLRERAKMLAAALRRESIGIRLLALGVTLWIALGVTGLGSRMSGDSLALHMMIGKLVAASGVLERHWFQDANEFYGLVGEMTYAALMQIANQDAAQIFTWV